jgi:hypothetical protein
MSHGTTRLSDTRALGEGLQRHKVLVEHWALKANYARDTGVAIGASCAG